VPWFSFLETGRQRLVAVSRDWPYLVVWQYCLEHSPTSLVLLEEVKVNAQGSSENDCPLAVISPPLSKIDHERVGIRENLSQGTTPLFRNQRLIHPQGIGDRKGPKPATPGS
jgi:hypothetical protein